MDDFRELKKECEERANELEMKLINCSVKEKGIDELINQAVNKLLLLEDAYSNGTNEEQRSIIGSVFTEKWVFDGKQHRAHKVNEVVEHIYFINKELEAKEKGTSTNFSDLSLWVTPVGRLSNSFWEAFRTLWGVKNLIINDL